MKLVIITLLIVLALGDYRLHHEGISTTHFLEGTEIDLISHIVPTENDVQTTYKSIMNNLLQMGRRMLVQKENGVATCSKGKDFFKIGAQTVSRLGAPGDPITISLKHLEDDCFEDVTATYQRYSGGRNDEISVTLTPTGKGKCTEVYLLATNMNYQMIWLNRDMRSHTVKFRHLSQAQQDNFDQFGLHIFRTCDSYQNFLPNLLSTVQLFFGGLTTHPKWGPIFGSKPAPWMEKHNVEFVESATGYKWLDRKNIVVDLDETEVQSGDYLAITRFDGLDQLIQYGTGSHTGHSAVLLEVDGELVVVESQDAWYWPKHKIQRNPWKQWKKFAQNAGFNVALIPLTAEKRAQFDTKKAEAWFKKMEGFPYGYHNFVFGWIDTPNDNFPTLLELNLAVVAFSVLEHIIPKQITSLVGEALNMRLGTKGLKMYQIQAELTKRGSTWGELYAKVENDAWIYSDGPSMVCSSFVIGIYKAGGLFDGFDINATEFTPKDVYQLDFFDKAPERPQKCKDADPDLPYCQMYGTHQMILPGFSTVSIYSHMNENCGSLAPDYFRNEGC